MDKTPANISNKSVQAATGKPWDDWFALLDKHDADKMLHKEIAAWLQESGHIKSGWWAQSVTVEYEKSRGRRILGQTADAGFQIGVQKTLLIEHEAAWDLITGPAGLAVWLGSVPEKMNFNKGETYETAEGTKGEIRTIDPGKKLRLTWQPPNRSEPTTLQIYLLPTGHNTSVRFHHEKLADSAERERMRKHWQQVLGELKMLAEKNSRA